jgi:predicted protein tyrosine phosphatase
MKRIYALSKKMFDSYVTNKIISHNSKSCYISILDVDNIENKYELDNDNFLQVKISDTEEDIFVDGNLKYQKPSDIELNRIVDFVHKNADKNNFIIHCSAGISRSGAVATYISYKYINDIDSYEFMLDNKHILPNKYILKRLMELGKVNNPFIGGIVESLH